MALVIPQVSKLKAEIRLAQAISEFEASLSEGSQRATFKVLRTRSPPSPQDVIRLTEEINGDGASAHHRSWQPHGTRLQTILERIQLMSAVGDVLVGGAQNLLASGIWAVVRMSLSIATGYLSYFDKVSDLLMRIGRTSSITQDIVLLFPKCRELQQAMCEYLIIIIKLCREVISFTKKPLWAQISLSFVKEFKSFETDLALRDREIEAWVRYLTASSQLRSEGMISALASRASLRNKQREHFNQNLLRLLRRLSPAQAKFDVAWRDIRKKGTASWIFDSSTYQAWDKSKTTATLHITGSLGSGKSVLMANIFASMQRDRQHDAQKPSSKSPDRSSKSVDLTVTACFVADTRRRHSLEPRNIIGSLANQFLKALSVDTSVAAAIAALSPLNVPSDDAHGILEFLSRIAPKDTTYVAVIDGLDECTNEDAEDVIAALSSLSKTRHLRLCVSSRTESSIKDMLATNFEGVNKVTMSAAAKQDELLAFIDSEVDRRQALKPLSPGLVPLVKQALCGKAQGMYLWVGLQIEALFPRYDIGDSAVLCDEDIIKWLEDLPPSLPETFDRAVRKIVDRRYGSHIFEIVAAAQTPLTLDEFRIALNVQPGDLDWNEATLPHDAERVVHVCGGGLLEVSEESLTVSYIHSSVRKHFTSGQRHGGDPAQRLVHFSEDEANMRLGYVCVTYLNYPLFGTDLIKTGGGMSLGADHLSDRVGLTLRQETSKSTLLSTVTSAAARLRSGVSPTSTKEIDIVHLLQKYCEAPKPESCVQEFLGYAREHWLNHCKVCLSAEDRPRFQSLLGKLLETEHSHGRLPWNLNIPRNALEWAIWEQHAEVFRSTISAAELPEDLLYRAATFLKKLPTSAQVLSTTKFPTVAQLIGVMIPSHNIRPYFKHDDILQESMDLHALRATLAQGADPNIPGPEHPLSLALKLRGEKALKLVRVLLEHKACPNGTGDGAPLIVACSAETKNLEAVKMLLDAGANIDLARSAKGATLVRELARTDEPEQLGLLKRLVSMGLPVTGKPWSRTLLFAALQRPMHLKAALIMLSTTPNRYEIRRLDVDLAVGDFFFNLSREFGGFYAAEKLHNDFLVELLELGADPNMLKYPGHHSLSIVEEPPLFTACRLSVNTDAALFRTLLRFGADPDMVSSAGQTLDDICAADPGKYSRATCLLDIYRLPLVARAVGLASAVSSQDRDRFDNILQSCALDPARQLFPPYGYYSSNPKLLPNFGSAWNFINEIFRLACEPPSPSLARGTGTQLYMIYSLLAHGYPPPNYLDMVSQFIDAALPLDFMVAFRLGLTIPDNFPVVSLDQHATSQAPRHWHPSVIAESVSMAELKHHLDKHVSPRPTDEQTS